MTDGTPAPAAAPAPAASPAPAAAPAPAASPAPSPAAAPAATPDYAWAGDDSARALAKTKGWATPADAIKSYGELEGLLGGEKLPLPKTPDDKAGWDRVYTALGRPDTADGYGIQVPENATEGDKAFINGYTQKAHELGLTTKQALELQKWADSQSTGITEHQTRETQQRIDTEIAQVKDNWGNNFNANSEVARRGADALGLDKATIDALEESPQFGHKKLMDMLLKVGQASGEGNGLRNPGGGNFNPVTKESAQARLDEIKANPQLRSEALKVGSEIFKEVDRLDKIIAGVRPDAA